MLRLRRPPSERIVFVTNVVATNRASLEDHRLDWVLSTPRQRAAMAQRVRNALRQSAQTLGLTVKQTPSPRVASRSLREVVAGFMCFF